MGQDTQKQIVTQSQIKLVLDYSKEVGVNLTLKELVGVTNVLVDYCMNGYSKEIGERLDTIHKSLFADKFDKK